MIGILDYNCYCIHSLSCTLVKLHFRLYTLLMRVYVLTMTGYDAAAFCFSCFGYATHGDTTTSARSRELAPLKRAWPHFDDYVPRPLESTHQYWEWYPAAIQTMIHEERVPPPRAWDTVGGAPTLPVPLHPMDQAFAAVVARLDRREREVQFMR